ncbi:hypothetical protein FKW77_009383 [Venturia effusa]|uniref:Uncharacterized protein n=1 Tax=Venturia effusa TaxID=50376 RepID=A0A517KX94_9PEZI|nr:hypothetical protein FKW77_009383 [Venturia effusa]
MEQHTGALSENIALLAQFGKTLTDPTISKTPPWVSRSSQDNHAGDRSLDFEQERHTAEAFALLLATSDDRNAIGAVCIEEQPDGSSFIVRTAVNSGSQDERLDTFRRLVNAARLSHKSPTYEDCLLDEIVTTSQARLLVRLRSKHAPSSRRTKGPPIIKQLQKFSETIKTQRFRTVQEAIANLWKDFDALEKLSGVEANSTSGCMIIKEILLKTSSLSFPKLVDFLRVVPPKESLWSNTPYARVVRKFQKLAQYVSAGRYLGYMIRKFPNWQIREANNSPYAEHRNGAESDGTIGLFTRMRTESTAKQRKQFMRNLETRTGKNGGSIEQQIKGLVSLKNRVHAEIQLLYHYEQDQQVKIRPRILCSNKEACYLCHLFITTHAKFHTQRSHGNFYPRWRLPQFDELHLSKNAERELKRAIARFSQTIETQIQSYLLQQPQRRQDPSESSVFLSGVYTPSKFSVHSKSNLVVVDEASTRPISHHRSLDSGAIFLQPVRSAITESRISCTMGESVEITEPEEPTESEEPAKPENPTWAEGPAEPEEPAELEDLVESVCSAGSVEPTEPKARAEPAEPPEPEELESSMPRQLPLPESASPSSSLIGSPADQSISGNSTCTELALREESYLLSRGTAIEIKVCRGSSARFHTPGILCEFEYGDVSGMKKTSTASDYVPVVLSVEWLSADSTALKNRNTQIIDVTAPSLGMNDITCDGILRQHGLILSGKGCSVMMRAVHRPH